MEEYRPRISLRSIRATSGEIIGGPYARGRHCFHCPHADRQGLSWRVQHHPRRRARRPRDQGGGRARRHRAGRDRGAFGVTMVGPVIIAFGSDAQKKRFLPRIANLDDWWCQGFSEPGSGSDLASLKTSAKRVNGNYVINGQKTWTTTAQYADWIFCLVRTDPAAKK